MRCLDAAERDPLLQIDIIQLISVSPIRNDDPNIEGFPGNVVALMAKGQVTSKDYDKVVIPKIEDALKRHGKIRLYYDLGSQFSGIDPGAARENLKIGIEHITRWERPI